MLKKILIFVLLNEIRGIIFSMPGWIAWFHYTF